LNTGLTENLSSIEASAGFRRGNGVHATEALLAETANVIFRVKLKLEQYLSSLRANTRVQRLFSVY